jgi:hypothetical protein
MEIIILQLTYGNYYLHMESCFTATYGNYFVQLHMEIILYSYIWKLFRYQ